MGKTESVMKNLFKECINRNNIKIFVDQFKLYDNNPFEVVPDEDVFTYDIYKMFTIKKIRRIYILVDFIRKKNISTDEELLSILKQNPVANKKYIVLVETYNLITNSSFVKTVKTDNFYVVKDVARKLQFLQYCSDVQERLVKYHPFYDYIKQYHFKNDINQLKK